MQREEGGTRPLFRPSLLEPPGVQQRRQNGSLAIVLCVSPAAKAGEGCLKHCWDSVSLSVKWHGHQESIFTAS